MEKLLKSYRIPTKYGQLLIEESNRPDEMSFAIVREDETTRVWITREQWLALCDLRYGGINFKLSEDFPAPPSVTPLNEEEVASADT